MEGCSLLEYRPGRYAWADPETGKVIRLATDEEADTELSRLLGLETLPLFALDRDNRDGRPEPGSEPAPPEVVDVATDAHRREAAPTSTRNNGNGRGLVCFVAYQDGDPDMVLANEGGRLVLYPNRDAAKRAAGILGVAAAVPWARLSQLCKEHGLKMPANGNGKGGGK